MTFNIPMVSFVLLIQHINPVIIGPRPTVLDPATQAQNSARDSELKQRLIDIDNYARACGLEATPPIGMQRAVCSIPTPDDPH